ncbi:hypothetical protein [Cupriavidus pauculus]
MATVKPAASSARRLRETAGSATDQEANLPPTKRLNVEMSEEEYYALKRYALEHRKTVSDVVREAIHTQMSK